MILKPCLDCQHGSIKEEKSFCEKEGCYCALTKCVMSLALVDFLEQQAQAPPLSCTSYIMDGAGVTNVDSCLSRKLL